MIGIISFIILLDCTSIALRVKSAFENSEIYAYARWLWSLRVKDSVLCHTWFWQNICVQKVSSEWLTPLVASHDNTGILMTFFTQGLYCHKNPTRQVCIVIEVVCLGYALSPVDITYLSEMLHLVMNVFCIMRTIYTVDS